MQSVERIPAWKAVLVIMGIALVASALIYAFMQWRVEQRELDCGKSCADKGFSGYRYLPPRGARRVSQDECECVKIK